MLLRYRPFRLLLLLLTLSTYSSCDNNKNQPLDDVKHYSTTQQYLLQLLKDYTSEYATAKLDKEKEEIQNKHSKLFQSYLIDSLGRFIDSMTVTVDTVIQQGWLVTTQFHTSGIEFKYGMVFKDSMDSRNDSLYQFMRSLKPKEEVTVNFIQLGGGELNSPEDKRTRAIRIFAYPQPLNF